MKVAVFGTSVSANFLPVLKEFFGFLRTNKVEIQLFKPFYTFLIHDLGFDPKPNGYFNSANDFDNDCRFISALTAMVLFFIRC